MDSPVSFARRLRLAAWPLFVAALLILATLFHGHRYRSQPHSFNSDDLFAVEVSEDLLGRGYELQNYHLPYAPYLFPDLLFVLGAVAVCKGLFAVFLVYNILYYGLVVVLLTALFRQTGLRLREAFLFAASGPLLLLVAHLGAPYWSRAFLMYHPTNHAGIILVGLLLSLLVVRNLHRRMGWLAATTFVLTGGLGLFSDRLLLPQFLAPLCSTMVVLAAFRVVPLLKLIETLILCGGAYALSLGVQYAFAHGGFVLLPLNLIVDFTEVKQSWGKFREMLPQWVQGQHLLKATFLTFVSAAVVVGLRFLRSARATRTVPATDTPERCAGVAVAALALIGLGCCVCNLGAVVVSGAARSGAAAERYLLGAVFIPFLLVGVCCRFLPGWPLRWLGRACPAVIVLFACVQLAVCHRQAFSFRELRSPYPEVARVLDRLSREHKIHHGLATFWSARRLHYLTREHVEIRPILPDGQPWLHSQNPNAYLTPGRRSLEVPHYDFILFNEHDPMHPTNRDHFLQRFGTPRETVAVGDYEVWLYDGLLSNELGLFLRSTLAPRCRAAQPYLGPLTPACLATPKANLTSKEARGTVSLAPDGEVKLTFPGPVKGEMIDLGAQYDAHFDLLFYHGDELLGTLYVPRLHVAGTSSPYCFPGNQSRLLTLPASVRDRGWTAVVVRGKGGPGCFALGHFLVYPQVPTGMKTRQTPAGGHWRYEAETQPGLVPGTGAIVEDSLASGRRARFAPKDFTGAVLYGPYIFLEKGRYRIDFLVKAEPVGATEALARLEVTAGGDCKLHAHRNLFAGDFAGKDGYQKFSLTLKTDVELSDCQFRVIGTGKAPLAVDCVDFVCQE